MLSSLQPQAGYQSQRVVLHEDPLPGFGQLMSQGAVTGACAYFLLVIFKIIFYPHGYDAFFSVGMPIVLAFGAGLGLLAAFMIWVLMKVFNRPLGWFARIFVASMVVLFVSRITLVNASYNGSELMTTLFVAFLLSLAIGSDTRPGSALLHGMSPSKNERFWPVAVVGVSFRLLMLFGWMESLLLAILSMRSNDQSRELPLALLLLVHFLINTAVVFNNANSRLMTSLAIVANIPWVFILIKFSDDLAYASYAIVVYLSLVVLFLVTHWPGVHPLFSYIRKELRYYYLID